MSRRGTMSLDSYRLAQLSESMFCYVCGEENSYSVERCRYCRAPLALAYQAAAQKLKPRMVTILGPSGSGKTSYVGMLVDILSKHNKEMQLLTRGAFSISVQESIMSALRQCLFPQPTPSEPAEWNWLHCQGHRSGEKQPIELILPDMAGDSISKEIHDPSVDPAVRATLAKAAGALILVDAGAIQQSKQNQDFFALHLVSYLCDLDGNRRTSWSNRPIAVIFAKADQCPTCFDDPSQFARQHAPNLWQQCQKLLGCHQFFAASIAGASAYRYQLGGRLQIPLRIEPRGVVEPFMWLVDQLAKRK